VETLTQHPPSRGSIDPEVPEKLPPPFFEIARECLRSDPESRATVADIAARLRPDVRPAKRPVPKWTYALGAATGLVLAALVIAPRLVDRAEPVPPSKPAQIPQAPAVQPAPKVQPSPQVARIQNEIVQRVLPEVPSQASRTIQGRVRVSVRVLVDPSGNVTEARLDSAGPSKYFAQLALQAARRWKFAPAKAEDPGRPREWVLRFEFSRTGTKAAAVRRGS
jgi:protein TonB